jgi:hypothetical protein
VVPLLRAEGSEEESQVGLVLPEDVRPSEAETMTLPRTPDESLVVDVARGLDSGSMIEQAHRILMQISYSVGYHREEGNVEGFVWSCVLAILSVFFDCWWASALTSRARRPVGTPALVCVCGRETSRTSSRWPMMLARWPCSGSLR